ncbi:unnamed protein product [Rangifer tarandus platyrhynchus]|uniref:Uncharacterized protein n=1 Tax=Rangifer tarandus platyrhynchus TaxID=3082113 RepID=A0ABN8YTT0_RANTA|nr:unnamed protein product [Rangifer tarandus platyrhynchus]
MRRTADSQVCAWTARACARTPPEGFQLQPSAALLSPRLHPATSQRVTCKANNHSPSPREPVGNGEGGVEGEGRGRTEKALRGGLVPVTQSESSGEERGGAQEAVTCLCLLPLPLHPALSALRAALALLGPGRSAPPPPLRKSVCALSRAGAQSAMGLAARRA